MTTGLGMSLAASDQSREEGRQAGTTPSTVIASPVLLMMTKQRHTERSIPRPKPNIYPLLMTTTTMTMRVSTVQRR